MKKIFSKYEFPKTLGGDIYEFEEAETKFTISKSGLHIVKIEASAKNAQQNKSTDDDDLRIALDGFHFGKYEKHDEKISWKGFGASSSWNGASLKGGTKTIYFFVELEKGKHQIQFYADMKPHVKSLEIFRLENLNFAINNLKPSENIESNKKGIPWLSLVFLGSHPKNFLIDVETKSAKEKKTKDGDNIKIVINGKILKNKQAPTSRKYKNFYFSGNIRSTGILSLDNETLSSPLTFENTVEIWYDQTPRILNLEVNFFNTKEFLDSIEDLVDLKKQVLIYVWTSIIYFRLEKKTYSEKFLKHSMKSVPEPLIFKSNHPIVRKIKADPAYKTILEKLAGKIKKGVLEGEIWPDDFKDNINFESNDLATSLHGIRKIEYKVDPKKDGLFVVNIILFDIYDFQKKDVPSLFAKDFEFLKTKINNMIDIGEELKIINNFEIQINIKETINGT